MSAAVPRVSVVVIVRDGERYLAEALESVAAQTLDDWETIVVDDGSVDGSRAIAERFAESSPERFKVVRHAGGANLGMSASRNRGIAESRAALVTFLDHDDAMLPQKLARQVALLDAHPEAAAVIGPNLRWHSWRGGSVADTVQDLGVALDRLHAPPGPLPAFLTRTSATPQAPMVRRAVIDAVGGFDESFRDMYEDQVFFAKLLLARPVFVSGEVWQRYRQHEESCVTRAHRAGRHLQARRRYLEWLAARIDGTPGASSELARVVRAERRRNGWARLRAALGLR